MTTAEYIDRRKATIAKLRKLIKAKCRSLRVRRGRGTTYSWIEIWSHDEGAEFTSEEKQALDLLGISHCANCANIAPEDQEAALARLEEDAVAVKQRFTEPSPTAETVVRRSDPDSAEINARLEGCLGYLSGRATSALNNPEAAAKLQAMVKTLRDCQQRIQNIAPSGR